MKSPKNKTKVFTNKTALKVHMMTLVLKAGLYHAEWFSFCAQ